MTWDEFVEMRTHDMKTNDWGHYTEMIAACPKCGAYLFRDNTVILTSMPPQHKYICKKCEWVGYTY